MDTLVEARPFRFSGILPRSKSLCVRLLLLSSYLSEREGFVPAADDGTDVHNLARALRAWRSGESVFSMGAGAAPFRFWALRVSRLPGVWRLKVAPRLKERPQDELLRMLAMFGVKARWEDCELVIDSEGWRDPRDEVRIGHETSSQFLSALLLNGWDLPFSLDWRLLPGPRASLSYALMSAELVRRAGLKIEGARDLSYGRIAPLQPLAGLPPPHVEPDASSAFVIAALAAVGGEARLRPWPADFLQPDARFVSVLEAMGVAVVVGDGELRVGEASRLLPIQAPLDQSPDLFPVLAALVACAQGTSKLFGLEALDTKESPRLTRICELFQRLGVGYGRARGSLVVEGVGQRAARASRPPVEWAVGDDHRLAFAGAVLAHAGFPLRMRGTASVEKSFPDFWRYAPLPEGSIP